MTRDPIRLVRKPTPIRNAALVFFMTACAFETAILYQFFTGGMTNAPVQAADWLPSEEVRLAKGGRR